MNLITGSNGSCAHYLKAELKDWKGMARPEHNLLYLDDCYNYLKANKPDVIYHLAAKANVRESFDRANEVFGDNTRMTINLFDACLGLNIRPTFVICSTSEVYGNPAQWPITEEFDTSTQTNPYAVSKRAQELIARHYELVYDFPVVITRAFGYVNPKRANLALTNFARQIVAIERGEQQSLKHGNLDSIRTFCDVRDIVKAYVIASKYPGKVFNIGSEEAISVGDALKLLTSYSQAEILTVQDDSLMRPMDVTNVIPSCLHFRNITGWQPMIPLKDSLQWLLSTCRA